MSVEFRAEEYLGGHEKIAAFIAGYRGKIASYQQAIHDLQDSGYDVVAYEYNDAILMEGKPKNFNALIELIECDFDARAASHKLRRYVGVSFGAALGINLQKRASVPTEPGLYGSAGADIARLMFRNPFFRANKKAFKENHYSEESLRKAWEEPHQLPMISFVLALGTWDFFVKYPSTVRRLEAWQRAGTRMRIIPRKRLGHSGLLKWFNQNIPVLLQEADKLKT